MPFKQIPPLYHVWMSMKDRCRNPNCKAYPDYGGRGISVCDRWLNSYAAFAEDMGNRPPGTSIERIDNNGNYEPSNCRWATKKEQQRNQRRAVFVTIEGVKYRAIELAELAGVKTDTITERAARGLSYADVIRPEAMRDHSGLALGGMANGARQKAKTHCPHGHEFTPENTGVSPEGWRRCRACHAARQRKRNAMQRKGG